MKTRSRTDIIATLLRSAMNGGATKMQLMYGAYLSWTQLMEYLRFLLEKDLLVYEEGSQVYKATEKASRLVRVYEEMNSMIADFKGGPLESPAGASGQQQPRTRDWVHLNERNKSRLLRAGEKSS